MGAAVKDVHGLTAQDYLNAAASAAQVEAERFRWVPAVVDGWPVSPDCQQGKHVACVGQAWDEPTDSPAPCACPCHHDDPQDVCALCGEPCPELEVHGLVRRDPLVPQVLCPQHASDLAAWQEARPWVPACDWPGWTGKGVRAGVRVERAS